MNTQISDFSDLSQTLQSPHSKRIYWLILLLVWSASALYLATHLLRGWVPHDEGAFAQSAERVLEGQLPHRDFVELYSGGLTFVHALAFRFIGVNLATLRYVLFAAFLAWIPAVYYVASRFGSPLAAGAVTLLCAAWSVPNYAAAVPSWYSLFLATFGIAALLGYLETRARFWIVVAGLCGGLSFTVKSVALYYFAGVWLFFLFREQRLNQSENRDSKASSPLYRIFTGFSVLFLVALIILLIRQRGLPEDIVHFALPTALLGLLLFVRESRGIHAISAQRFSTLAKMAAPFFAGALLPVLIVLVPFIRGHAIHDLIRGVFILPARRISGAAMEPPKLISLLAVAPLAAVLALGAVRGRRLRLILNTLIAMCLAGVFYISEWNNAVFQVAWHSAANLIPVLSIAGAALLVTRADSWPDAAPIRQQRLMLLLSVMALCSLVQFPFSAAIYFCYVAPLAALTLFALLSCFKQLSRPLLLCVCLFYFVFAIWRISPGFIYGMGESYMPDIQDTPLKLERGGGLRITSFDALLYPRLIDLVRKHATGRYIYAAPDCPEVYFLSGFANPTRTLFDFLDDPAEKAQSVLTSLETHHVEVVVIFSRPAFSGDLPDNLQQALEERFPNSTRIEPFEVRWR